jgi:hypothetical protein
MKSQNLALFLLLFFILAEAREYAGEEGFMLWDVGYGMGYGWGDIFNARVGRNGLLYRA